MQETEQLIDQLLKYGSEKEWIEFKSNHIFPEKIGETISALANAACLHQQSEAFLIFGIDDKRLNVVGTSFDISMKGKGAEDLEPWLSRLVTNGNFSMKELFYKDKRLVIFFVSPATKGPVKFDKKSYIRIGSHIHSLEKYPDKESIIWDNRKRFEERAAMEDVDIDQVITLLDVDGYYRLIKEIKPEQLDSTIERFHQEGFIKSKSGKINITNLGAIILAKDLKEFPKLEGKKIRVITYQDNNRLNATKDILINSGYGPAFEAAIGYINMQVPNPEHIGGGLRKTLTYPEHAIREFFANSLVHQDFSIHGSGPVIEIFNNRIEICNLGQPLIDPYRFIDSISLSRNEKLVDVMRRMGICEKRGSGVDRAILSIELAQLPAPEIKTIDNGLKVTIYSYKNLNDLTKEEKIRACYFHSCIKRVLDQEPMTNSSLSKRLGIEEKNKALTSRILKDALSKKLIKSFDPDSKSLKYAKYVPYWH